MAQRVIEGGGPAMSLEEVGQALGISKERVRQLENRALAKMRAVLERRGVGGCSDLLPDGHTSRRDGRDDE